MSRPTSFLVDGTVYWTINTYNENGVLVDADSNPYVDIRRNGTSLPLDVATISKRGGATGTYDCSYNPSTDTEGDCYQFEETAIVSSQAYKNTWNCEVVAAQRGTDGANTVTPNTVAPDNASVAAILADTNELQGNQGDWATATGFNTVAPDNASIAAILADTADLQANQGDWLTATTTVASNMRGTDNALLASSAPANWSTLIVGTGADAGKVTTSNPASGGGSAHTAQDVANLILAVPTTPLGNTATGSIALVDTTTNLTNGGSGGDDAATIYNYFTDGSREDAFKANTAGLSTLDAGDVNSQVTLALGSYNTAKASDVTSAKNEVVADIAALNDFDPSSDVVARVTLVDTTTNLTNGGSGGGDSASDIYNYFTDSNRELAFQADVSANALEATLNAGVQSIIDTGNAYWTTGSGGGGGGGTVTVKATPTPRAF